MALRSHEKTCSVLVTGGTGFVAPHVLRALSGPGRELYFTFSSTKPTRPLLLLGRARKCDLSDPNAVQSLIDTINPDVVVHCAALTNTKICENDPSAATSANLIATWNILRAMPNRGLFVLFSTDWVFDGENAPYDETQTIRIPRDLVEPLDGVPELVEHLGPYELTPRGERLSLHPYGATKAAAEYVAALWSLQYPQRSAAVLRCSLVYGPRAYVDAKGSFLQWMSAELHKRDAAKRQGESTEPFDLLSDEVRTPIYVGDVSRAVARLVSLYEADFNATAGFELYHMGGAERLSRVAMGNAICSACSLDESVVKPVRLADVPWGRGRPRDLSLASRQSQISLDTTFTTFVHGVRMALTDFVATVGSSDVDIALETYRDERDIPDLDALLAADLSEPYSIYTYRYFLDDWPHLCMFAVDRKAGNHRVGVIVCRILERGDERSGYIAMLAVLPRYRRQGIARKLVEEAIARMRRESAAKISLETESSNAAALSLYERLGFVREQLLQRYYLNHGDAFRLMLPLS